jgi:membrane-bound metal-dependent hydrolase YbcI (DUF457 family)
MDIVTHALIGLVMAAPCLDNLPLAVGLVIGSVMPDLDVLSRLFGKRAMILCHQGFSHSLIFLAMVAGTVALAVGQGVWLGLGLLLGGLVHVALDFSNTLGVKLYWPLSDCRHKKGWVFFLDAFVTVASAVAFGTTFIGLNDTGSVSPWHCATLFAVMVIYWCAKAHWLKQAHVLVGNDLVSLVPSALVPWQFIATTRKHDRLVVSKVDVFTGIITPLETYSVMDCAHAEILAAVSEWRLMRGLSPAYHVVSSSRNDRGLLQLCRDLRVRNFNSTYGDLELQFDAQGTNLLSTKFHV